MIKSTDSQGEKERILADQGGSNSRTSESGLDSGQHSGKSSRLDVQAVFCSADKNPFDDISWDKRTASITGDKGEVIFEQRDVEVPSSWSVLATNIVASKYFYGRLGTV